MFPDIQCDLEEVYVGTEKEGVNVVDPSLVIAEMVPLFSRYIKYAVGHPTEVRILKSYAVCIFCCVVI